MNKNVLEKYLLENIDSAFRFAYTYTKNREDAEDVVSDSIVKALKSVKNLKNPDLVKPWFYKIIANTALTYLKKSKKITYVDFTDFDEQNGVCDDYSYLTFESMVKNLEPEYKSIIVLRFFENMQINEIAEVLSINENTVKTRLYKALKILKVQMEGDFDE